MSSRKNVKNEQVTESINTATERREWMAPVVTQLPRLSELTLQSPINGGGGTGGGGSTVVP